MHNVNSKLFQAKGRSSRSKRIVVNISADTSDHPCKQGSLRKLSGTKALARSAVSTGGEFSAYVYHFKTFLIFNRINALRKALTDRTLRLFYRYSPSVCAEIGKYTCQHGIAAAARYFSWSSVIVSARHYTLHQKGILRSEGEESSTR